MTPHSASAAVHDRATPFYQVTWGWLLPVNGDTPLPFAFTDLVPICEVILSVELSFFVPICLSMSPPILSHFARIGGFPPPLVIALFFRIGILISPDMLNPSQPTACVGAQFGSIMTRSEGVAAHQARVLTG